MTEILSEKISANLGIKVIPGYLDGLIVDAHIYENTFESANMLLSTTKSNFPLS